MIYALVFVLGGLAGVLAIALCWMAKANDDDGSTD